MEGIIQKEAIYCAVGRCAHRLKDSIDFRQWLDIATNEINNTDPKSVPRAISFSPVFFI